MGDFFPGGQVKAIPDSAADRHFARRGRRGTSAPGPEFFIRGHSGPRQRIPKTEPGPDPWKDAA